MAQHNIDIVHQCPGPVDKVFAYLSRHENLNTIFAPVKVKTLKPGQDGRHGLGSVRQLRLLLGPPFEETVTAYRENELIEYRITRGSPLKNHLGTMRFSTTDNGGTRLHYTIGFDSKLPFIGGLVRSQLEQAIRRGLKRLPV